MSKIKKLVELHQQRLKDRRTIRVVQFLQAKGFLFAFPKPRWRGKLKLIDCLWVGTHVEPRVLEVLPAAYLRFPGHFQDKPHGDFGELIEAIQSNHFLDFRGIPFEQLSVWLNCPLSDKRTKPHRDRRLLKAFRLSPGTVTKIAEIAKEKQLSEGEVIDWLARIVHESSSRERGNG